MRGRLWLSGAMGRHQHEENGQKNHQGRPEQAPVEAGTHREKVLPEEGDFRPAARGQEKGLAPGLRRDRPEPGAARGPGGDRLGALFRLGDRALLKRNLEAHDPEIMQRHQRQGRAERPEEGAAVRGEEGSGGGERKGASSRCSPPASSCTARYAPRAGLPFVISAICGQPGRAPERKPRRAEESGHAGDRHRPGHGEGFQPRSFIRAKRGFAAALWRSAHAAEDPPADHVPEGAAPGESASAPEEAEQREAERKIFSCELSRL